jgi:hypothetical protein
MKPKRVPIFAVTIAVALTSVTGASLGNGGTSHGEPTMRCRTNSVFGQNVC